MPIEDFEKKSGLFTLPDLDSDPDPVIDIVPKMGPVTIRDLDMDRSPRPSNGNMFYTVQCSHRVWSPNLSRYPSAFLTM